MLRRAALTAVVPLAVLLAVVSLAVAPVALAGDPCYHGFDEPQRWDEATTEVKAMPCAFGPTIARVPVGATVTWYNGEDFTHLVTGANQEWGSRDTELLPGTTVSYRFEKAGIYPYACALHRGMSGVIVVGDAVASAGGASGNASAAPASTAPTAPASGPAASRPGNSPGPETALAMVVAGAAVVAVVVATVVARRRKVVAL
jgi:plastocyanin